MIGVELRGVSGGGEDIHGGQYGGKEGGVRGAACGSISRNEARRVNFRGLE